MSQDTLPDVIVIGTAKGGTTALHYYLDVHPEIAMSRPKEVNFFADRPVAEGPGLSLSDDEFGLAARRGGNWSKGVAWYRGHFNSGAAVHGEASPDYTAPWYPDAAEKMASVIPDAKLIFVARDPVDRAVAHYLTLRGAGRDTREPETALARLQGLYVSQSRYHALLEPYYEHFRPGQILVLDQDELRNKRAETVSSVYRFLGVDDSFWSDRLERERNPSTARPRHWGLEKRLDQLGVRSLVARLPPEVKWKIEHAFLSAGGPAERPVLEAETRRRISDYLSDDVAKFRERAGKSFSHWSL